MTRLVALLVLAACATSNPTPRGGPRGLRASDHQELARQHEEQASQGDAWPVRTTGPESAPMIPWSRSWNASEEHLRFARIHRSEAAALHAAFDEACAGRTPEEISISPLKRYGVGGTTTPTGVILYLDPKAGSPDKLMADMRCHRAWMMLAPGGMETCSLDLPGLTIDAHGDAEGITVTLGVKDSRLVEELQHRAAHDLEASRD